jgi:hypothetical protein
MNNKERELYRLLDIAIQCCATTNLDGSHSITKEDILGKTRIENVVMTRCVLIRLILHSGYSITTAAKLLNRTVPAIRYLEKLSNDFSKTSRAYRIAVDEAFIKLEKDKEKESKD